MLNAEHIGGDGTKDGEDRSGRYLPRNTLVSDAVQHCEKFKPAKRGRLEELLLRRTWEVLLRSVDLLRGLLEGLFEHS